MRLAVRLGWYLAEVRGRNWWLGHRPASGGLPPDADAPLPLRPERTVAESRQQAFGTLAALAERLGAATPPEDGDLAADGPFAPRLAVLMRAIDAADGSSASNATPGGARSALDARQQTWHAVALLMHQWDSVIQDELTARADILACAYLLGRGLSESYWALAPEDEQLCPDELTPSAGSWEFLFGPARRTELSRMVGRLGPYLNPLTPVAVTGSLQAWGCVAADEAWRRQPSAPATLYEQLRRWYQLLVLGQDPSTLLHPYATLRGWRSTLLLSRAFWPQLLLAVASVALVASFVVLLTTGHGSTLTKTLLAVLGTVGVSAATVLSKAKSATQTLLTRLRQDSYSDLVAIATTVVPPHPQDRTSFLHPEPTSRRIVTRAVAARTLTVATPQPDTPPT